MFLLGLFLIWRYPVVFWDDAYTRLAYRDQLLVGRWLPAIQLLVFLTGKLPAGLVILRVLLAGIAAVGVLAVYRYTAGVFDPATGLLASDLLATHTLYIALATVPYREVLIVTLCFLILYYLERAENPRSRAAAYALILLLSLTREDAWLFVPVFILLEAGRGFKTAGPAGAVRTGLPAVIILCPVPLLWFLFGPIEILEHEGNFLDRVLSGQVAALLASLLDHAWWRTRVDLLLFGGLGAVAALRDTALRRHPLQVLTLAALQLSFLIVAGIWREENLRMTFLPVTLLIPFAARGYLLAAGRAVAVIRLGLPALQRSRLPAGGLLALAAAGFAALVYAGVAFVAGASHAPVYQAGYAASAAFAGQAYTGVLVLTDAPVGPYVFASFTDVPLEAIFEIGPTTLDHGLGDLSAEGLAAVGVSHVVGVYGDSGGLSPEEFALIEALESGDLPNVMIQTWGPPIWQITAEASP